MYVAKIDQGMFAHVAYVASVSARHVASVSDVCSKCFIC
jgi:surface antigen